MKRDAEIKQKNFLTVLLFCSILVSTLYYFNREATDLEGIDAYCGLLLGQGKMIYRDFSFYVPPLYIIRHLLAWRTFNGAILAMRILGLAERAVLFCLIFRLLCRWFKPIYAYAACLTAFFFYNTNLFNSYGDYTQVTQLLLMIAVFFAIRFDEALGQGNEKRAFWNLFAAGVFATNSLMCKHSIGAVAIALLFVTLLLHCLARREGAKTWKWVLCVIFSFGVALLPYLIWLTMNGALLDFWNQVFLGSLNAKGIVVSNTPKETSTFSRILATVFTPKSFLLAGMATASAVFYSLYKDSEGRKRWSYYGFVAALLLTLVSIFFWLQSGFGYFTELVNLILDIAKNTDLDVWVILPAVTALVMGYIGIFWKKKNTMSVAATMSVIVFIAWFWTTRQDENRLNLLLKNTTDQSFAYFYELAFWGCVVYFGFDVIHSIFWKKDFLGKGIWYYLAITLANAVVSLMGGGTASFACNGALLTIPFSICLLFTATEKVFLSNATAAEPKRRPGRARKVAATVVGTTVLALCCNVACISMAQHIRCVYSFYGWTAMPIADVRAYPIDLERYGGMLVPKRTKVTLEQITKLVEENTTEEDFVWSFPATKIYNILANRMDQPTHVTTYFFDTCSDAQAIADLEILKRNPPDLIIWKDVGEDCWEFYEKNYRNGAELGQREIQRWFEDVIKTDYQLIGNAYNEYVYLRSDRTPNYTYYSDGNDFVGKIEETAGNVPRIVMPEWMNQARTGIIWMQNIIPMVYICLVVILTMLVFYLTGADPEKIIALLLYGAAAICEGLSWTFVFAFVAPLICLASKKKKSVFDWMSIVLLSIAVVCGCFQWSRLWVGFEQPAVWAIIGSGHVLLLDVILSVPRSISRVKLKKTKKKRGKYEGLGKK